MSLEQITGHPVVKELVAKGARYEARIQQQERASRESRINALFSSRRIGAPRRDKFLATLGTTQFSLSDDGGVSPNGLDDQLALLEELPAGAAFALEDPSKGTDRDLIPVDNPAGGEAKIDPKKAAAELIAQANAKYASKI